MGFLHRLHKCEWSTSTVINMDEHGHFSWSVELCAQGLGVCGWDKALCVFVYQLEVFILFN